MDYISLVEVYKNIQEAITISHQNVLDDWRWCKMSRLLERLLVGFIVRTCTRLHDLLVNSRKRSSEREKPQRVVSIYIIVRAWASLDLVSWHQTFVLIPLHANNGEIHRSTLLHVLDTGETMLQDAHSWPCLKKPCRESPVGLSPIGRPTYKIPM